VTRPPRLSLPASIRSAELPVTTTRTVWWLITELADAARKKDEPLKWIAQEVAFGSLGKVYYVSLHPDHADIEKHGDAPAIFQRVLGEKKGLALFGEIQGCIESTERGIAVVRPDLSYPQEEGAGERRPLTSLSTLRARPGAQAQLEELIRKVAEAVPKTGGQTRLMTYQALTGGFSNTYYLARPLNRLADLDRQPIGQEALVAAYGKAEGERIFRSGGEAIQDVLREILVLREERSNPPR
jgi:hypothetical protein